MKKATLKIYPLDLGTLPIEKSVFTLGRNQGVTIDVPCLAWAIVGGKMNVLVDSGPPDPERSAKTLRAVSRTPDQELGNSLKKIGLHPEDIDLVIFTHLHWDHCFNLERLIKASFIVQKKELQYAVDPLRADRKPYQLGTVGYQPTWTSVLDRIKAVDGEVDLLPGIKVIPLPGHTPGSQGIVVETTKGPWVITGDAIPLYENWDKDDAEKRIPGGVYQNLYDYYNTINKLGIYEDRILPGHEKQVLRKKVYPA